MGGIRYKGQVFSGAATFGSANDVAYDNTESGLTADNVQDALDEVNTHGTNMCPEVTTDYNDAPVGFSKANENRTHAPFNFWSGLITLYHEDGNYQQQLALPYTRSEGRIAYRSKENGTWGDWQYFSRVQYRSDVYTNVNGNYVFLTQNPGNGYALVNAYDGDWNNGTWKPSGIFSQNNTYGLFFDKEFTNATIRIDSFWMKI